MGKRSRPSNAEIRERVIDVIRRNPTRRDLDASLFDLLDVGHADGGWHLWFMGSGGPSSVSQDVPRVSPGSMLMQTSEAHGLGRLEPAGEHGWFAARVDYTHSRHDLLEPVELQSFDEAVLNLVEWGSPWLLRVLDNGVHFNLIIND